MKLRSFEELLTEGQMAEAWVRLEMESNGFHCIGTSDDSTPDLEFRESFFIEVKFKEEMLVYPKWNGFNLIYLPTYLSKNTFMLFILPYSGVIYGQWLNTLYLNSPWMVKGEGTNCVIIFHRDHMRYDYIRAIKERLGDWD